MHNADYYNAEGYPDPTAYHGMKRADNKAYFLIRVIKYIIWESGFEVIGRIEIRDRKTGKEYK